MLWVVAVARYQRKQILSDHIASPDAAIRLTREQLLRTRIAVDAVPLAFTGVVPGLSLGFDALAARGAPPAVAWIVGVGLTSRTEPGAR